MWGSAFYSNMKNTWPHHFTTRRGERGGCAIKTNSTHHFLLRVSVPNQDVERYFACGNRVFDLFWRSLKLIFSFYHSLLPVVNASWYFVFVCYFSFYYKPFQTKENCNCPENTTDPPYPEYDCNNKKPISEGMYKNRKLLLIYQQVLICWIRVVVVVIVW